MSLTVQCPAFTEGQPIPRRHTGDGEDLSPPLTWSSLPSGTRQLSLIVDDPDAPTDEPWVHWVIYNLSPEPGGIAEGVRRDPRPAQPGGAAQGVNSWKTTGYRGPAPPRGHGVHHYHFKLYALDAPLGLEPGLDKRGLMNAMSGHILGQGELVGTYERPK
jgi:Raf kinase inhibitor-like YbhB/YbcL family protein